MSVIQHLRELHQQALFKHQLAESMEFFTEPQQKFLYEAFHLMEQACARGAKEVTIHVGKLESVTLVRSWLSFFPGLLHKQIEDHAVIVSGWTDLGDKDGTASPDSGSSFT